MTSSISTTNRTELAPWQAAAILNPFTHFAMLAGISVGKTFTGSHFVIDHIEKHPDKTGFIGANSYDQLTQATLRELFYWLDLYGYEYVIDRIPPMSWGQPRTLKTYRNVLSVRAKTGQAVTIFTRVLSDPNGIRGTEFSWYWLDESRDTIQLAHDIVLSRLRESDYIKGLITTTPNGEDWVYQRFCKSGGNQKLYGSMHVKTERSVEYGIITRAFYDGLRRTYSPLLAAQELDAEHVNVLGGRAYYAAGAENRVHKAPWGDVVPDPSRPLIVGCDFNFHPAPCVWIVGQSGPEGWGPNGEYWPECIHWFGEVADTQMSSTDMTNRLLGQYPGFFYQIFGDASGNRGSTSNAGDTDYIQIQSALNDAGALYSIDVDQANPMVKNRIETMNALFKNAVGEVRQTYNPDGCPLFDGDLRVVGWKPSLDGRPKLDACGDNQRTHASDAAGYAVWKLFPIAGRAQLVPSIPSSVREGLF